MQSKGILVYKGEFGLGLYVPLKGEFTILGSRKSKLSSSIGRGHSFGPKECTHGFGATAF
jgi:hypothetical protein